MSYQVIARKWRPQRFEEVVGQVTTTQTLQNAIRNDRIAHAYLFSGARGVGKTTTARILAKALNCKNGPTPSPCGACSSCEEIAEGNSLDVIEIDAASNRGINEIRELRELVKYNPARDRHKVFIIDEVHMLTPEAFNALLKTLEEPPPHVVFILATTELHKVPVTIVSRCQQFDFKNVPHGLISERLRLIAQQENISISEYALQQIAIASEGSLRDAQSIFDQIIAFSGREVKDQDVMALLGLVDQKILDTFTQSILDGDAKKLLLMVDELVNAGHDVQNFCRKLIAHMRNLLVIKVAGSDASLLAVSPNECENLKAQAAKFSEEDLLRFYDNLSKTETELKWSNHPRYHMEIGLMKLVQLKKMVSLEELIHRFDDLVQKMKASETLPQALKEAPSTKPHTGWPPPRNPESASADKSSTGPSVANKEEPRRPSDDHRVEKLLSAIERERPILRTLISGADSVSWKDGVVEISLPPGRSFIVSQKENADFIKKLCADIANETPLIKVSESIVKSVSQVEEKAEAIVEQSPQDPIGRALDELTTRTFLETFPGKITT